MGRCEWSEKRCDKSQKLDESTVDVVASHGRDVARGETVRTWGLRWLNWREHDGVRSIADDRGRWRTHVESDPIADMLLTDAATWIAAREWYARLSAKTANASRTKNKWKTQRPLALQTLRNVVNLVRQVFEAAKEAELIAGNPFATLRPKRTRGARTKDVWCILRVQEQDAALFAMPTPERWIAAVALGSLARKSELWNLRLEDVHAAAPRPFMVLRYGTADGATKGGRPRRVPLFGMALEAMRYWLAQLPTYAPTNPDELVFPDRNGKRRSKKHNPRGFSRVSKIIGRPFRWHDWRHTGCTSLVAGWWDGEAWSKERVQRIAGHSSVVTTERYVHWLEDEEALDCTAARMPETTKGRDTMGNENKSASGDATNGPIACAGVECDTTACEESQRRGSDSNRRMTVLQTVA